MIAGDGPRDRRLLAVLRPRVLNPGAAAGDWLAPWLFQPLTGSTNGGPAGGRPVGDRGPWSGGLLATGALRCLVFGSLAWSRNDDQRT